MSGSLNKVLLIGNLGSDPEVRSFSDGQKVVTFRLATSESWNDRESGERKSRTEWHNIAIRNDRLADVAERFLKKGAKVYLEGALQTREWNDRDGNKRYTTEIVLQRYRGELTMLGGKGGGEREEQESGVSYSTGRGGGTRGSGGDDYEDDGEIPF